MNRVFIAAYPLILSKVDGFPQPNALRLQAQRLEADLAIMGAN
ncbi:hypothetical protein ACFFUP_05860 [Vibrio ostreicida]|uniref:Uncharacterized protein n=1 Tax=Vibrio ostreicida TaxID=526588 RepID=A0ABT8BSG9_9VIBR|nr:hypothetical protein [Vibrio ostreicida]MDN3609609.1 hypothetical protein [Vibrio ostreicida]